VRIRESLGNLLDIADAADTTVIVLVPESGDSIQAMKAGLMEIGEIFVVNKADRDGADTTVQEITSMLALRDQDGGWSPPVLRTIASTGEGVPELAETIGKHREFLSSRGLLAERRRAHFIAQLREIVVAELEKDLYTRLGAGAELGSFVGDVSKGHRSPYQIAREVLDGVARDRRL